ncbi:MAG: hypothetical protein DDG60_14860 [Anaerolineae bacterium]|nr:MAG: hypothetical protein DDG60_14860 [Anaerolineae bacterium]
MGYDYRPVFVWVESKGRAMSRFALIFSSLLAAWLVTACAQRSTDFASPTPIITRHTVSGLDVSPSAAPATMAPLQALPTTPPTFDAQNMLTMTPAPKAKCPKTLSLPEQIDLRFLDISLVQQENLRNLEENLLAFLNQYGSTALFEMVTTRHLTGFNDVRLEDWTNDGQPEMILGAMWFFVFGCRNGEYVTLLKLDPDGYLSPPSIYAVTDVNRDNIPEITMRIATFSQGGQQYDMYSWNGIAFVSLLQTNDNNQDEGLWWLEGRGGNIQFSDLDEDGIQEVIVDSGVPGWSNYYSGLPWRNQRTIYGWNGNHYVPRHQEFSPPEFRFQAIQDADLAVSQHEYKKAIALYQQAIFDASLKPFSPEIKRNLQERWNASIGLQATVTPTDVPPDPKEYPILAAYAYYRMVILHVFLGELDAAQVKYNTLQQKFQSQSPGHPWAKMATDFWNAYRSDKSISNACQATIATAQEYQEVLAVLGSNYHGWQSHFYQPEDVCPFH